MTGMQLIIATGIHDTDVLRSSTLIILPVLEWICHCAGLETNVLNYGVSKNL